MFVGEVDYLQRQRSTNNIVFGIFSDLEVSFLLIVFPTHGINNVNCSDIMYKNHMIFEEENDMVYHPLFACNDHIPPISSVSYRHADI